MSVRVSVTVAVLMALLLLSLMSLDARAASPRADETCGTLEQVGDGWMLRLPDRTRLPLSTRAMSEAESQEWRDHLGQRHCADSRWEWTRRGLHLPDPNELRYSPAQPQSWTPHDGLQPDHLAPTFRGPRQVALFLVHYVDGRGSPYTPETGAAKLASSSSMMTRVTYTLASLVPGVVLMSSAVVAEGPCTVEQAVSIANQAEAQAAAGGFNPTDYDHLTFSLPFDSSCGWAGLGTIGGSPGDVWWNGLVPDRTVVPESLHNGGLWHTFLRTCAGPGFTPPCMDGDGEARDCLMGRHCAECCLSLLQAWHLQLVDAPEAPPVRVAHASGVYAFGPRGAATMAPKGLIIPVDGSFVYGVEVARPLPGTCDAALALFPGLTDGVLLSVGHTQDGQRLWRLNATPSNPSGIESVLRLGQVFADATAGLTIMPVSVTDAGAEVLVAQASDTLHLQVFANQSAYTTGQTILLEFMAFLDTLSQPAGYAVVQMLVVWDGIAYPQQPVMTDAQGRWTFAFTVPPDLPRGTYGVAGLAWWPPNRTASTSVLPVPVQ